MVQDGVIAFLSAVGLVSLVWGAAEVLFHAGRPTIPGLLLVLPLEGDAPAMEADLRELRRIRHQLPGSRIVLEDRGLRPEARRLAEFFSQREEYVVLREENEREQKESGRKRENHGSLGEL